jgi:hypothetical protein
MDTLEINVKGWPPSSVQLLKQYAEQLRHDLGQNGFPEIPEEDRQRLAERGVIRLGTQYLSEELRVPPEGEKPSGVLEALLDERAQGR